MFDYYRYPMSILCVFVPAFRLGVARLGDPSVALDAPVLVADKLERGRVLEVSRAAAAFGARAGMTLVQGQAAARDARVVVDDPGTDASVWNAMLEALDAASPLIEDGGWGCAFCEMHGIEGGADGWLGAVRAALAGFDLPLRLGVAASKFVARAAALAADGTAVPDDGAAEFLAPLPIETLELDSATIERFTILGVNTLGELAALPHGPFVRRFGADAARWHDRARGIDRRPLTPRPREMRIDRTLYGEGTAAHEEQVLFALRTLVGRVVDDLSTTGKRCGKLVLALECEDGDVHEIVSRVAQPTAQPATLFELLRARLEGVVLRSSVAGLRLSAEGLEDGGVQIALFAASDPDPDTLGIVIARLDAALGETHALRARVLEGPRVERRFALEPFTLDALVTKNWASAAPPPADALPGSATLQYRIVTPAPVDVMLGGGVPRFVGSPPQAVLEVAGPWRVDEGWWTPATGSGEPLVRDEYDVLLEDGALVRIARESGTWSIRGVYD
ncbi:MAG: DNA polymerase Y family protein [Candidatus Velthaea sp.]